MATKEQQQANLTIQESTNSNENLDGTQIDAETFFGFTAVTQNQSTDVFDQISNYTMSAINNWILDSGASKSYTMKKSEIQDYERLDIAIKIKIANN